MSTGFFGSNPIGFNHPHFERPEVKADLLRAAQIKIANSDVYSESYAEFVETFVRVAGLPPLERYLFIEGGALAIENTLKAAMDWKNSEQQLKAWKDIWSAGQSVSAVTRVEGAGDIIARLRAEYAQSLALPSFD